MFLFWAETDKHAKQRRVKLAMGHWAIVALATLTLLGGCGGSRSQRATGPAFATGPACVRLLAERGIAVQPWQGGTRACPIDTPIRALRGSVAAFAPPLETSCSMLLAWSGFEAQLDPTARAILGSPVVAIRHYGSFGCRNMTDGSSRPSLHAQARAIDVAGFVLADGRTVTVLAGWYGRPDERRFLRAVAVAACQRFSVVLTPNSDRYHRDHIHVDIGPWRKCGV
jgi:hypothetical protein